MGSVQSWILISKQPPQTAGHLSKLAYVNTIDPCGSRREPSRDRSRRKKNENDAPPEEIKRKIVFSDLRNPPNNFTPLFGEVAKFRTLTKKDEQ